MTPKRSVVTFPISEVNRLRQRAVKTLQLPPAGVLVVFRTLRLKPGLVLPA